MVMIIKAPQSIKKIHWCNPEAWIYSTITFVPANTLINSQ